MIELTRHATIHCGRGVPPDDAIPSAALAACGAAVLNEDPRGAFQYVTLGRYLGDESLRKQLSDVHHVHEDCIFVSNGSLQVLDLLARVLLQSGRRTVYVESPTYDRAIRIFERYGGRVVGVPMERDGLDVELLQRLIRDKVPAFLYTIPDFQNPTGATLSSSKRSALADLAERTGFIIVEDSPYRRLRYQGTAPATLQEIAAPGQVVSIGSLAKVLSPGLRVGYAISTPELSRRLAEEAENTYLSPPPFCQRVAARALALGLLDSTVARCIDLFRPRWEAAVEAFRGSFSDSLFVVPDGGYFIGLYFRGEEHALLSAAREAGLILTPGHAFFPGPALDGVVFIRLPFQGLEPPELVEAVRRLSAIGHGAMMIK